VYTGPFDVSAQGTTTIRFVGLDAAGNQSSVESQVVKIDTVAPSNALSLSDVTGDALLESTTVWYRGVAAGSFTLTNGVSDALSGPASSATAALTGSTSGWSHAPSVVSAPAGGPYVSAPFSWAAGSSSSPGETVTGRDVADNTATASLTFTDDSAGPTGGSVSVSGLVGTGTTYSTSTSLSVAFAAGSDAGAGLASSGFVLNRASATLTSSDGISDGTCGSFGAYAQVGGSDPSSPVSDVVPAAGTCYRYQYIVVDRLGNTTTYTSGDVKVDTSAPTTPTNGVITPVAGTGFQFVSGSQVFYNPAQAGSFTVDSSATDGQSGIARMTFPSMTGFTGGGAETTAQSGTTYRTTYAWSNPGGAGESGAQSISATNNATLTTTKSNAFNVTRDGTAPTTTDNAPAAYTNSNVVVTLSPSDNGGGSGVASTYYTTDGSSPTPSSSSGTSVSLTTDGIYPIKYFSVDRVGNQESVKTSTNSVRIDKTSPTAPSVVPTGATFTSGGGTVYIRNGVVLTELATDPTVNAASSGVASVQYLRCAGAACTPTTSIDTSASGPTYSVTWTGQPADGVYRIAARVTDVAGNTVDSAPITVAIDNAVPVTTDNTSTIGNAWKRTNQTVTLTPSDPVVGTVASGVANTYFTIDGSTPTTSSSAGTAVSLSTDGLFTVKYFSTDNVGNTESTKTAGTQIRIDKTNPAPATLTLPTFIRNGATLTNAATDPTVSGASSGVASVAYLYCIGAACIPSLTIGSSSDGLTSYSVSWTGQPADGVVRVLARVTDVAGNTADSNIVATTIDNTVPTASLILASANGALLANVSGLRLFYKGNAAGSFTLSDTVSDAGSGPQSATFPAIATAGWTHNAETVTAGNPTFISSAFTWTSNPSNPSYTVSSSDVAGNTTNTSITFVNDTTAPTGGALTVNGTAAAGATTSSFSKTTTFSIGVRTDYTEVQSTTASGLQSSTLVRTQATLNNDATRTCGAFGSATTIVGSPTQDAAAGIANGTCYQYTLTGTDNVGNAVSISTIVKVDTTAPTATNVVLANGGTLGRADQGDTVTVTYSESMDAAKFCPSLFVNDGTTQTRGGNGNIVVTITNSGANDVLTITTATGCGAFAFGSVTLGADYVAATTTFSGNGSNASVLTWDPVARTFTIKLGNASGSTSTGVAAATPTYTANTALTDLAGNAIGAGPYTGTNSRF
jgi:hypothetical protein